MLFRLLTFASVLGISLMAKTYSVDGIVVAVDRAAGTMLVSHRAIPHYMPAMMMPFRVEHSSDLTALYPGARIQFDLDVNKTQSLVRRIRPSGGADAVIPPAPEKIAIGGRLPEFRLTDQSGRTVGVADLRDKVVVIDFIYTRCPLPDVCPRLSANFAVLQRRFRDQNEGVLFLSVTVDPDFDTPAVLGDYARRWAAGPAWRFLTGDVTHLAGALGEIFWADEGSIGHNSTTSIIGRDGRLCAQIDGSSYRLDQLEHLIQRQLETHP